MESPPDARSPNPPASDSGNGLSDGQILESAQDWLEWFRECGNPQTAQEYWAYLDEAATHLELVLEVLERLLPDV